MTASKKTAEKKPRSFFMRFLAVLVLIAGSISIFQYTQTGLVNWYQRPYLAALEYVDTLLREAPEISPDSLVGTQLTGLASNITDGDTFILKSSFLQSHTIRLHGVDTPEWDQPHGAAASAALKNKILGETVNVEIQDIDTYGRYVGIIYMDGRNINLELVAEGHAWWYEFYAGRDRALRTAQGNAREQALGLWAYPDPVPPWDWRRSR